MTTQGSRDWHADYDYTDPKLLEEFPEIVADLHARCPVAHSTVGEGYWITTRYEDVRRITREWETFSNADGFMPNRPEGLIQMLPEECDPPLHTQLREALNPVLAPKVVKAMELDGRRHAHDLIDALETEIDYVTAYGNALPTLVFCENIAGVPAEDGPRLHELIHLGTVGPYEGRAESMGAVAGYFLELMQRRDDEGEPGEDLVGDVMKLSIPGFGEGEEQWNQRAAMLTLFTFGGIGTIGYTLARTTEYLARNPDDVRRLREEPALLRKAIEEFLRVFPAAPNGGRRCMKDTTLSGQEIKKGDFLLVGFGAAGLDPELTEDPEDVKIDRFPNPHTTFGAGNHRCIGSHVARMELQVGLEAWLERVPEFSVAADFRPDYDVSNTAALNSLPMTLGPIGARPEGA
jgi:cytochrome P450